MREIFLPDISHNPPNDSQNEVNRKGTSGEHAGKCPPWMFGCKLGKEQPHPPKDEQRKGTHQCRIVVPGRYDIAMQEAAYQALGATQRTLPPCQPMERTRKQPPLVEWESQNCDN